MHRICEVVCKNEEQMYHRQVRISTPDMLPCLLIQLSHRKVCEDNYLMPPFKNGKNLFDIRKPKCTLQPFCYNLDNMIRFYHLQSTLYTLGIRKESSKWFPQNKKVRCSERKVPTLSSSFLTGPRGFQCRLCEKLCCVCAQLAQART